MSKPKHYWFKRRRYGYGWVPVSWQGWMIITVYLIVVITLGLFVDWHETELDQTELILFFVAFLIATTLLIVTTYIKGPRPKWRWGTSKNDDPHEDY